MAARSGRRALLAVLLLAACSDGGTSPQPVDALVLSPDEAQVVVGRSITFVATARTESGAIVERDVAWSSSNQAVATVSGGVATGVRTGTALIRASVDGVQAEAVLRVALTQAAVEIRNPALAPGLVGGSYTQVLEASGGDQGSYAWSVVAGALPAGLQLDASAGEIRGIPSFPGRSTVTLRATSGGSSDERAYVVDVVPNDGSRFDMTVVNLSGFPAEIQAALDRAVERWEKVVRGDLPSFTSPAGAQALPPDFCDGAELVFNGATVDDLLVAVRIVSVDGPGSALASAGPCGYLRQGVRTSYTGLVRIDLDDLAAFLGSGPGGAQLAEDVIFHELGHVLGFGTQWDDASLLTGAGTADPRYRGSGAVGEYRTLGGAGNVPVENDGGDGTVESHWEESGNGARDQGLDRVGFDAEIMTGFIEGAGVPKPLSRMTIAAVADLGFTVSYDSAQPFALVPPAAVAGAERGVRIAYGDDAFYRLVLPDGRIVQSEGAR